MTPSSLVDALTGSGKSYRERNLPTSDDMLRGLTKSRSRFSSDSLDPTLAKIIASTTEDLLYRAIQEKVRDEERMSWRFDDLILPKGTDGPLTMRALRADLSRYSPAFRNLDRVIRKYGVVIDEIRADNLGIGSDGRLVLLDSSIF
jgi:hypothetical protein